MSQKITFQEFQEATTKAFNPERAAARAAYLQRVRGTSSHTSAIAVIAVCAPVTVVKAVHPARTYSANSKRPKAGKLARRGAISKRILSK